MATETQTATPPPVRILSRVASIPIISSSLTTIDDTLSSNAYFRSPYSTAKGLSTSAYKYSEPLQIRLAPLILRADGYANMAVDAVESRYPYPFTAKPGEVASYVKERQQTVVNAANKTLDEKVKTPAVNVAQGIDRKFAPIVDYFEDAVTRFNGNEAGTSTSSIDTKYQYQRAYALSVNLRDELYVYSNEQLKQVQFQNALVQRATETAQTITALASSSITSTQTRIHALSDKMLAELQKLQSSFPTHLHSPLPPHLQSSLGDLHTSLNDLSTSLGATINDLRTILVSDAPVGEKATKVGQEVQERISPLLERLAKMVGVVKNKGEEAAQNGVAKVNGDRGTQNGVAKANGDRGTQNGAAKSNGQPAQNGSSGTRRANGVNGHAEK